MVELQVLSGRIDQYPIYVRMPRLGELCEGRARPACAIDGPQRRAAISTRHGIP